MFIAATLSLGARSSEQTNALCSFRFSTGFPSPLPFPLPLDLAFSSTGQVGPPLVLVRECFLGLVDVASLQASEVEWH